MQQDDGGCGSQAPSHSAGAPPAAEEADNFERQELASLEVDCVKVCGLRLPVLRRRTDYFAACAGDLPIKSTGLVLWECGLLLADYLGFARWVSFEKATQKADAEERPWWMINPPAPVVPTRFWSDPVRGAVLELGGGCGLVAAVVASLGASVVCTDGDPAALRTADRNCREARRRKKEDWGDVKLRELSFGDAEAARHLVRELGPFSFVVGSDLLYGDGAPPEPLIETLAALAAEPGTRDAEVILAVKNRCADEVGAFCSLARARGLWEVRLADSEDLPEGYDCGRSFYGSEDYPAYHVIHLKAKRHQDEACTSDGHRAACGDSGTSAIAVLTGTEEEQEVSTRAGLDGSEPQPPAKRARVTQAPGDEGSAAIE